MRREGRREGMRGVRREGRDKEREMIREGRGWDVFLFCKLEYN